jgi:eukaryotic-like serine/threonine-protein kinase
MPRMLKLIALAGLLVGLAGASAYLSLTFIIRSQDTVVVPELVGRHVVYALEVLSDLGLNTRVRGSEFNPEAPKHSVLFQDPTPGAEIKKGRDVRLILSKGPETLVMPNITGLTSQQARLILEENGLCLGHLSRVFSPRMFADGVLAQVPAAGSSVRHDRCADLLVSAGPRPAAYAMPDLTGLGLDDAILLCERSHLTAGRVSVRHDPDHPLNVVIGQNPAKGSRVTAGASVELVINRRGAPADPARASETAEGRLFRFRLPEGFLKQRVRVHCSLYGIGMDLVNDYFRPGQEIWLLVPAEAYPSLVVYVDEEPVRGRWLED